MRTWNGYDRDVPRIEIRKFISQETQVRNMYYFILFHLGGGS